ncbi:MAG: hypothetical protein AAGJ08_17840 [Cyanobacteria bacterium P01_H01_bin.35]
MQEFIEADFLLFIRAESQSNSQYWYGRSLLYMKQVPKYLLKAKNVKFAEQLLSPLGLETIEELRDLISHAKTRLEKIWRKQYILSPYSPLINFQPEDIGSI